MDLTEKLEYGGMMDLMKTTMQEFKAALDQRAAMADVLRRLLDGYDPTGDCHDGMGVHLADFSTTRGKVTLGEIRKAVGSPFGMPK